ncbi:MAG: amino acid ABC transporter permease [Candidatus Dependentiae bacterium]
MLDINIVYEYWPAIVNGTLKTVQIAFCSCILGVIGGTSIGLLQAYAPKYVRRIISLITGAIKGTPMLIQITFAFFLLPQIGIQISAFWTTVIAIGINSSSYLSSVIYGGIKAIPMGQIEAAHVLGFSRLQTIRSIILPQAFSIVFPALGNELITLIKDSSLASIIGVMELTKEAAIMRSRTYDVITTYTVVACIYLILTTSVVFAMYLINKRMHHVTD